jgi:hypothetical protein
VDRCEQDPVKTRPGVCGCGRPETDSDGDGSADCIDECPEDPDKVAPGRCGCGASEDCQVLDEPAPTPPPDCGVLCGAGLPTALLFSAAALNLLRYRLRSAIHR